MTMTLTELNKLIEQASGFYWTVGSLVENSDLIIASRTALPNALRVIAECRAALKDIYILATGDRIFNISEEALAAIDQFYSNVTGDVV
jgi:hypothetical protein